MVTMVKVAQDRDIPTPATIMATPVSPRLSTMAPARGGPPRAALPLVKVRIPKAVLRDGSPSILMRAGGVLPTQTPVIRPNTAQVNTSNQKLETLGKDNYV